MQKLRNIVDLLFPKFVFIGCSLFPIVLWDFSASPRCPISTRAVSCRWMTSRRGSFQGPGLAPSRSTRPTSPVTSTSCRRRTTCRCPPTAGCWTGGLKSPTTRPRRVASRQSVPVTLLTSTRARKTRSSVGRCPATF